MSDPITRAVEVLNDALARDPEAITALVNHRENCSKALARHPTIGVGVFDGQEQIGVLGLINGILGDSPTGVIGAKGIGASSGGHYVRVEKFVDLRLEKTDVIA